VFDLIPFFFPEALAKSRILWRWFYKTKYPAQAILRSADAIITTSEHTKHDLRQLLRIPPDQVHVVWIGLDRRFHSGYQVPREFFQKYHLPDHFLLYVGRQDPYKGLQYLVRAYALLPATLQQQYQVVIAGKTDPRYIDDVYNLIHELHLEPSFHFLDYIPDEDLPRLYSAATLLTHPSLYEGFGLPPLEAMACGTPVVYAETSALSESIGDAGLAVTAASPESLAHGVEQLLHHEQLRRAFSEKGLMHVQRYSWGNITQRVLMLYKRLNR
jgi:glycosyltransferase involved in cell wall biosynthesis